MDYKLFYKFRDLYSYGVVKSILNKLTKHISDEIESNSTPFEKDDLQKLVAAMSSMRAALDDPKKLPRVWSVEQFTEVAYEIEDLLDEAAIRTVDGTKHLLTEIGLWRSHLKSLLVRLQSCATKLELYLLKSMKGKADDESTLFIKTRAEIETSYYHYQQPKETILGREEDKEQLIHCILRSSREKRHAVIVVTGAAGIGKTTLVKLVCNDSRVSSNFNTVLWASVFCDGYASDPIFNFLESDITMKGFNHQEKYTESFKHRLSDYLRGKKCLLVLDSIRPGYKPRQNQVSELLELASTGSTVILITRQYPLYIERFTEKFEIKGILEEECWSLFKRHAFDEDAEEADPLLKDIGRSIVRRCCGSPLAVKTLASSLRNNRDRHSWEHIDQSELWGGCLKTQTALYLSFEQVPVELMICYATFSIIARDICASRDQVVYFWMAQGLLQSGMGTEDLRDVGNRYCNQLLSMNLLRLYGTDYVTPVFVEAEMFVEHTLQQHIMRLHNIWDDYPFRRNDDPYELANFELGLGTTGMERTFLFRDFKVRVISKPFLEGLISNMKHLRTLFLDHSEFEEMPEIIADLEFLRYLSLAGNHKLQALPHSICKLLNLQTLDLSGCVQLKQLPRNMHQLISLRHFLLSLKLPMIPEESLTSWGHLHHLKICNCPCLDSLEEGMQHLTALRALGIHDCPSIASLPDSINLLTNLKELSILNCQNLDLTGWGGLLELRSLKSLQIQGLPKLLELPDGLQFVADSLQRLVIINCENLRILPESLQHCTCIVELINCPNLFALPQCTHLRGLKIRGCPKLQEQLGALNLSPSECQSHPSSGEIRPASPTSPSEISRVPEIENPVQHYSVPSPSEHNPFSPTSEGAAEHPHPVEHSHQPTSIPLTRQLYTVATSLWNRGAASNKNPLGKQIFQRVKKGGGLQEIVVKVDLQDTEVRREVFKAIVSSLPGVTSVSYTGEEMKLVVIGESVDLNILVSRLRKWSPEAELLSELAKNKGVGAKKESGKEKPEKEGNSGGEPSKEEGKRAEYVSNTDATGLENQDYNKQRLGRQVPELEKEVEGKKILLLFGEGYEFEKEMLIQLWIALGVLTDEPMEVMGADYFEKLVSEGYILWTVANSLYRVNTGKLNTELDMITDKQNYVMLDNGNRNDVASTESLHVSVVCDETDKTTFKTLGRFNRLRTLLFLGNYGSRLQQVPRDLFLCYESLLALDLSGTHIKELPSSANKMINLRYLDLSWTFIKFLPEGIDRFKKLQTLKLKGCSHLHRLPKEIKGLTELRHLDLDVLGQLAAFPEGMGALVNLRTLSAFPIGTREGLRICELKYLNNLTGEFCIANLENVKSAEEAKEASLTTKRSIAVLELRWIDYQLQEPNYEDEPILENLCPHSDLEEIQIMCYPGTRFPRWIFDTSFHKLNNITLFRCEHVSVLPSLGKLPSLKSFKLVSLNSVTKMDCRGEVDDVAFPMLQKLVVDEMHNVEAWTEAEEGDYPCLTEIRIKDCPKLPELPCLFYLTSLEQLELSGCKNLAFVSEEQLPSSLQQLIVEDCPLIKARCSEKGGQDWHKIYHVPNIWIDQEACETYEEDNER